ncbi:hypothetical protein IV203_037210 [Nitzschia inconspicua]|uniref:Uncharacterized protein n=1 Tax=Nitzschia inconspicua TaxID=303405 RepID=A0A9K3LLQ5_9STRA|nr:hypothetical protein IV203_037210 [Nitzschia inconspicua]
MYAASRLRLEATGFGKLSLVLKRNGCHQRFLSSSLFSNSFRRQRISDTNASLSLFTMRNHSSTSIEKDDDGVNIKSVNKTAPVKASSPSFLPGIAFSAATATAGFSLADILSTASGIPISGIPLAILTGIALNNSSILTKVKLPEFIRPGIQFSTKTILQGGIVAVAAKLSFVELVSTGSTGLPVVLASLGAGLTLIPMYGNWAGLPKEMSLLLTAGTSICGVTAITALAPAIQASNRDIAVAVANTVAFGTIGMLVYPYIFHSLCTSSEQVGMCLGVGIHDTSQVLGAAMSYKETFDDEIALKVAAITKLSRNLGLAVAIPGLTYAHATTQYLQHQEPTSKEDHPLPSSISGLNTFQKYVPPFLIAFVGMSGLRSMGDIALGNTASNELETFRHVMDFVGNDVSKYALGTAMAGVGLSTSLSSLQGVGWKPFAVGAAGAFTVGGTGFAVASMMT